MNKPTIAVAALGHYIYFNQFEGLREDLTAKADRFCAAVLEDSPQANVIYAGYADNVESGFEVAKKIHALDADLIVMLMTTYVPSSVAACIARNVDVPVILVGIQPLSCLDYQKTTTYMQLCNDDICAMPEVAGVFRRMRRPLLDCIVDAEAGEKWRRQVAEWVTAAGAKACFRYEQIGYLGHTYEGMYDMHTDPTAFTAAFGAHVKMLEMCELMRNCDEVTKEEIAKKIDEIRGIFEICDPSNDPLTDYVHDEDLELSARTACALDRLMADNRLNALAYYYKSEPGNPYETIAANLIIGNTLLTTAGTPLAGEADLKTAAAMLIMKALGGGGSFAEIHPFDVNDDVVLIGHDGPHNILISQGKPRLRKLKKYHGKSGSGIGVEFSIRSGPITLLSINANPDGTFRMIAAEAESLPGDIPQTGNTNTRVRFKRNVTDVLADWCMASPTHHLALGTGHHLETLKKFAKLSGIELVVVE